MTDITSRLKSVRARIMALAKLAGSDDAVAARMLAAELTEELDRIMQDAAVPQSGDPHPPRPTPPRTPRDEVEKCPRCALRGFTFQKGTIREMEDGSGGFEGFYRCTSCGHEAWREIR